MHAVDRLRSVARRSSSLIFCLGGVELPRVGCCCLWEASAVLCVGASTIIAIPGAALAPHSSKEASSIANFCRHLVGYSDKYVIFCAQGGAHGSDGLHNAGQASASAAQGHAVTRHKRPRQELPAAAATAVHRQIKDNRQSEPGHKAERNPSPCKLLSLDCRMLLLV